MAKPSPSQIQAAETSVAESKEEEVDMGEPPVDQVYCWWLEMAEMKKTAICVRKSVNVKFSIHFISETELEIRSAAALSDEEIGRIGPLSVFLRNTLDTIGFLS